MSTLLVEVCEVLAIDKHPNADRLAIATVKGWNTCISFNPDTQEPEFKVGEKCVFFPPDSVLPPSLANSPEDDGRLGIVNYCSPVFDKDVDPYKLIGYRVRAARLRGHQSFGFIMRIDPDKGDDANWVVGEDVKDHFGITKWDPPERSIHSGSLPPHDAFHKYTDIEHYGNFPTAIEDGDVVSITEKLHGTNARAGLVLDQDDDGNEVWIPMAGSHKTRLKEFDEDNQRSLYWSVMDDNVLALLNHLKDNFDWPERKRSIIVFAEIFGSGVQDIAYGLKNGKKEYRVFDIAINGLYLDYLDKISLCDRFNVNIVPKLYEGRFYTGLLEEMSSGNTRMCDKADAGNFKGKEGIVITPVTERTADVICGRRCILKYMNADYSARSGGTDSH